MLLAQLAACRKGRATEPAFPLWWGREGGRREPPGCRDAAETVRSPVRPCSKEGLLSPRQTAPSSPGAHLGPTRSPPPSGAFHLAFPTTASPCILGKQDMYVEVVSSSSTEGQPLWERGSGYSCVWGHYIMALEPDLSPPLAGELGKFPTCFQPQMPRRRHGPAAEAVGCWARSAKGLGT